MFLFNLTIVYPLNFIFSKILFIVSIAIEYLLRINFSFQAFSFQIIDH